jgi:hypothetical protein
MPEHVPAWRPIQRNEHVKMRREAWKRSSLLSPILAKKRVTGKEQELYKRKYGGGSGRRDGMKMYQLWGELLKAILGIRR